MITHLIFDSSKGLLYFLQGDCPLKTPEYSQKATLKEAKEIAEKSDYYLEII